MRTDHVAARGALRHVFASTFAFVLSMLGMVVLGLGIVVGPVGAVLGTAFPALLAWQWRRLPRQVLEVDGAAGMLRHGLDGAETVALDAIAGGIVQRTGGTTYRGIRTGADVEHWLLVGHDGRALQRIDGRGFSTADLTAVRSRIGGTWMSVAQARRDGMLPVDAPWHMRHPGAHAAMLVAVVVVTIALALGTWALLARIGRDAFLWPWW